MRTFMPLLVASVAAVFATGSASVANDGTDIRLSTQSAGAIAMPINPGSRQLGQQLKHDFARVGLVYPGTDQLTQDQVVRLQEIFSGPDSELNKRDRASTVLAQMVIQDRNYPISNQLATSVSVRLRQLRVPLPEDQQLSFQQVLALREILQSDNSDSEKRFQARSVLGF